MGQSNIHIKTHKSHCFYSQYLDHTLYQYCIFYILIRRYIISFKLYTITKPKLLFFCNPIYTHQCFLLLTLNSFITNNFQNHSHILAEFTIQTILRKIHMELRRQYAQNITIDRIKNDPKKTST